MAADVINYIDITDEWLSESNIGSYIVCDGIMIDEKLYLIGENGVYMHERLRTKEVEIAKCTYGCLHNYEVWQSSESF